MDTEMMEPNSGIVVEQIVEEDGSCMVTETARNNINSSKISTNSIKSKEILIKSLGIMS